MGPNVGVPRRPGLDPDGAIALKVDCTASSDLSRHADKTGDITES
jgi:hypothetical protein